MNEYNPDKEVVFDLSILQQDDPTVTDQMIKELIDELNSNDYVYDRFMETAYEILEEIRGNEDD